MEKAITLSNGDKSLIWSRFIQPANGTQDEANHFIQVCEQFGLNPLLGDIVFQRYESRNGARTQFITTRDGLLRVATRQPGYVGPPNANVVKEGDHFEFLPAEGSVKHQFGTKRGKILGAYAIMKHKQHHPVAVFVDFEEYFRANSGKLNSRYGNDNVWDKMPSAMIVKIAEVFVLRRQFPLGGLYTQEEMGLDETAPVQEDGNQPQMVQQPKQQGKMDDPVAVKNPKKAESNSNQMPQQEQLSSQMREMIVQGYDTKISASQKEYVILSVKDAKTRKTVQLLVRQPAYVARLKQVQQGVTLNLSMHEENGFVFLDRLEGADKKDASSNQQTPGQEAKQQHAQPVKNDEGYEVINGTVQASQPGQKDNTKFVKMAVDTGDHKVNVLAHGDEHVAEAMKVVKGQEVAMKIKHENGFHFFMGLSKRPSSQAG